MREITLLVVQQIDEFVSRIFHDSKDCHLSKTNIERQHKGLQRSIRMLTLKDLTRVRELFKLWICSKFQFTSFTFLVRAIRFYNLQCLLLFSSLSRYNICISYCLV